MWTVAKKCNVARSEWTEIRRKSRLGDWAAKPEIGFKGKLIFLTYSFAKNIFNGLILLWSKICLGKWDSSYFRFSGNLLIFPKIFKLNRNILILVVYKIFSCTIFLLLGLLPYLHTSVNKDDVVLGRTSRSDTYKLYKWKSEGHRKNWRTLYSLFYLGALTSWLTKSVHFHKVTI